MQITQVLAKMIDMRMRSKKNSYKAHEKKIKKSEAKKVILRNLSY